MISSYNEEKDTREVVGGVCLFESRHTLTQIGVNLEICRQMSKVTKKIDIFTNNSDSNHQFYNGQ